MKMDQTRDQNHPQSRLILPHPYIAQAPRIFPKGHPRKMIASYSFFQKTDLEHNIRPSASPQTDVMTRLSHAFVEIGHDCTKTVQRSIRNIYRNIKAALFKIGTKTVHHKRKKMTPVLPIVIVIPIVISAPVYTSQVYLNSLEVHSCRPSWEQLISKVLCL